MGPMREGIRVYRFDFVLTVKDGSGAATPSTFTLVLEDGHPGEVHVGKNVPLTLAPPSGTGPALASPRQDVGLKVKAIFRPLGDDVLLDVNLEMSQHDPPSTIRKVTATGNALASPGKPALVTVLDDDKKHWELNVTATKMR